METRSFPSTLSIIQKLHKDPEYKKLINKPLFETLNLHIFNQVNSKVKDIKVIESFLTEYDDLSFLEYQDNEGNTVLHHAARLGHFNIVNVILEKYFAYIFFRSTYLADQTTLLDQIKNNKGNDYIAEMRNFLIHQPKDFIRLNLNADLQFLEKNPPFSTFHDVMENSFLCNPESINPSNLNNDVKSIEQNSSYFPVDNMSKKHKMTRNHVNLIQLSIKTNAYSACTCDDICNCYQLAKQSITEALGKLKKFSVFYPDIYQETWKDIKETLQSCLQFSLRKGNANDVSAIQALLPPMEYKKLLLDYIEQTSEDKHPPIPPITPPPALTPFLYRK